MGHYTKLDGSCWLQRYAATSDEALHNYPDTHFGRNPPPVQSNPATGSEEVLNLYPIQGAARYLTRTFREVRSSEVYGGASQRSSTSLIPARKLLGPSSSVAVAKVSHSPRFPAMETIGACDPDARIRPVRRPVSFLGREWHSRTRSKSRD
jgi:hypothetical protein